jgi:hypothetical protein
MNTLEDSIGSHADEPSRRNDKELERWAAEIAGLLNQAPAPPQAISVFDPNTAATAPELWQRSVGPVTLSENEPVGGSLPINTPNGTTTAEPTDSQIQVRVQTQEFGEIAVVVERLRAGLRVLIGAEDTRAADALQRQSQSVRHALEQAGENVQVVEVVRMQGNGTQFASTTTARNRRPSHSEHADAAQSEAGQPKRRNRRVNLSG